MPSVPSVPRVTAMGRGAQAAAGVVAGMRLRHGRDVFAVARALRRDEVGARVDLEAKDARDVLLLRLARQVVRVDLEKHMRERRSKVRPVQACTAVKEADNQGQGKARVRADSGKLNRRAREGRQQAT